MIEVYQLSELMHCCVWSAPQKGEPGACRAHRALGAGRTPLLVTTLGREGRTERRRPQQRPRDATCGGRARRKPPPAPHRGRGRPRRAAAPPAANPLPYGTTLSNTLTRRSPRRETAGHSCPRTAGGCGVSHAITYYSGLSHRPHLLLAVA